MASKNHKPAPSKEPLRLMRPTLVAAAVGSAFHNQARALPKTGSIEGSNKQTWEALLEISDAIGNQIATTAEDISSTVELVKHLGCEHIGEFNAVVNRTNSDLTKFASDFLSVKNRHAGKTGFIETPDDLALSLSIYEDYQQFRAHFDGTMHHTLISFTEYALEAKDRAVAIREKELAEEAAKTKQDGADAATLN